MITKTQADCSGTMRAIWRNVSWSLMGVLDVQIHMHSCVKKGNRNTKVPITKNKQKNTK